MYKFNSDFINSKKRKKSVKYYKSLSFLFEYDDK